MLQMFKCANVMIIGAMGFLVGSCASDDLVEKITADVDNIPVTFNVRLDDYNGSRSESESWPDGACVMVYSSTTSDIYGFVTYSSSNETWTASIKTGTPTGTGKACRLYYVKGLRQSGYGAYSTVSTITTQVTVPHYTGEAEYDYSTGVFNLSGTLIPRTGRLRLKGTSEASWMWKDAECSVVPGTTSISLSGSYSASTEMTKSEDDNYYTPYLYVETVPTFRNNEGIYKYFDETKKLQPGKSVVIDVPSGKATTPTWVYSPSEIKGSMSRVNVWNNNPKTILEGNYESSGGFRFHGSFYWEPYSGTSLSYTSTYNTPFHFVVRDKNGNTTKYYPNTRISRGTYNFDFKIEKTSISRIYLEESHFDVYVTINNYTLEFL